MCIHGLGMRECGSDKKAEADTQTETTGCYKLLTATYETMLVKDKNNPDEQKKNYTVFHREKLTQKLTKENITKS